ncbi:carboxymuconolactone decarboxylase family protein [Gordonia rhizosphera]|nr:carboxymuconolactone decarboxylase family protein [Gordonia rhizosphera]
MAVLLSPERINPRDAGELLATLVRNPPLAEAYLTFNAYLLRQSTLSARYREIAVLRVVHRQRCGYLWTHHVPIAQSAGLTMDDLADIATGHMPATADRLVITATDELLDRAQISTGTWDALEKWLDERQRMDLVFVVGCYGLLATAVNTFGVGEEPAVT